MDEKTAEGRGQSRLSTGAPIFGLTGSIAVIAALVGWLLIKDRGASRRVASGKAGASVLPTTPWKNAQSGVKFVGDQACARCHAEIADSYRHHPMGRSLQPITVDDLELKSPISFEANGARYMIERRGDRVIHRETKVDPAGHVLAEVEAEVKYALGSGERGISYLIERDDRLFQSPITWYRQKNNWDLSPGYEKGNLHFDRPIEAGCLFCHANRAQPVAHTVNQYERPLFRGHAIGCERCHGPGELHVRNQQVVDGRDLTIVNPRHLEPALRSAVCEQCHLQGDHRVARLDRDEFDFRPGLPLIEFFAIYGRSAVQETRFVGQVEQMKESRCYTASQGRFGCTSCHDPHQSVPPEKRAAYYRQQCQACHESKGCSLPRPTRLAESPDDSCIQCHMPRFKMTDIIHTATTDHRILRHADSEEPRRQREVRGLPLVLLNGGDPKRRERDPLNRELAIALATEGPRLHDSPEVREMSVLVLTWLDQANARRSDDVPARRAMARVLALSGRRAQATAVVKSALAIAPEDEQALDHYLAYAVDEKQIAPAVEIARRAVAANPWSSVFHERLAHFLLESGEHAGSLRESSAALKLNPFLRFARMFLIQSLLGLGEVERADVEYGRLTGIHPDQRRSLEIWYAQLRRK